MRASGRPLRGSQLLSKIAQLEAKIYQITAEPKTPESELSQIAPRLPSNSPPDAGPSTDHRMSILLRGVNHITIETGTPEFYGPSSANAIINAVEAMDAPDNGQATESPEDLSDRAQLWLESTRSLSFAKIAQSSLPPKEIADGYLGHFFHTAHRIYPILNREHFMRRYNNFWGGLPTEGNGYEIWVAVLCMVLALGHQCSTADPDPRISTKALQSSDGETCFGLSKAMLAHVAFTSGDMSVVNSIFLAVRLKVTTSTIH